MAKDKTLLFAVLCFIHIWTFSVDSKTIHLPLRGVVNNTAVNKTPLDNNVPRNMAPNTDDDYKDSRPETVKKGAAGRYTPKDITLSMVKDAVDDRYDGCTDEMKDKVNNEYLPNEMNQELFKNSSERANICARNVSKRFKIYKEHFRYDELENDHIKAICAYTAKDPKIYDTFNEDVRTQNDQYETTFQYHTLHFWLTDALRVLKENQPNCNTTYRRTKDNYIGEANKLMRFGYFASSSLDKNVNIKFGNRSCFEIYTCFGAYLKSYPDFGNSQKEVLIPPYEVFKVTAVLKKNRDAKLWCDTVYKLKSTEQPLSNLNCKLVRHSAENNL